MQNDILIVSATEKEVTGLLENSFIHSREKTLSEKTFISAHLNDRPYDLIITGPSVINTAHALTIALERNRPKIIIQTGYAGIFPESGLCPGDITVAEKEQYIHAGVESTSGSVKLSHLPFPLVENMMSTASGTYSIDENYVKKAYAILLKTSLANECTISRGPVITVSTITSTLKTRTALFTTFSPLMEAMEGAASQHVASLYNIPFIEVRSGSNYVGDRDRKKWDIPLATKRLTSALCAIIDKIL